jgi:hypothetical protein
MNELGLKLGTRTYQLGYDEEEAEHTEHRMVSLEELKENESNNFVTRVKSIDG